MAKAKMKFVDDSEIEAEDGGADQSGINRCKTEDEGYPELPQFLSLACQRRRDYELTLLPKSTSRNKATPKMTSSFPAIRSKPSKPISTSEALKHLQEYLKASETNPYLLPNSVLAVNGPKAQSAAAASSNLVIHNLKRVEAGLRGEWLAPELDLNGNGDGKTKLDEDPFAEFENETKKGGKKGKGVTNGVEASEAQAEEEGWQDLEEYQREQSIEMGEVAPRENVIGQEGDDEDVLMQQEVIAVEPEAEAHSSPEKEKKKKKKKDKKHKKKEKVELAPAPAPEPEVQASPLKKEKKEKKEKKHEKEDRMEIDHEETTVEKKFEKRKEGETIDKAERKRLKKERNKQKAKAKAAASRNEQTVAEASD